MAKKLKEIYVVVDENDTIKVKFYTFESAKDYIETRELEGASVLKVTEAWWIIPPDDVEYSSENMDLEDVVS